MIFFILISFYLGFDFKENLLPYQYFIEFQKKTFIYGIGGNFNWHRSSDIVREFLFNLKIGFEKGSPLKDFNNHWVFLLIPGHTYKFSWSRYYSYADQKYYDSKKYVHTLYINFVSGISASFLIKNLDLKIRIASPFLEFYYYNELSLKISDKEIKEKERRESFFLYSRLLRGPLIISLLIKI